MKLSIYEDQSKNFLLLNSTKGRFVNRSFSIGIAMVDNFINLGFADHFSHLICSIDQIFHGDISFAILIQVLEIKYWKFAQFHKLCHFHKVAEPSTSRTL